MVNDDILFYRRAQRKVFEIVFNESFFFRFGKIKIRASILCAA